MTTQLLLTCAFMFVFEWWCCVRIMRDYVSEEPSMEEFLSRAPLEKIAELMRHAAMARSIAVLAFMISVWRAMGR